MKNFFALLLFIIITLLFTKNVFSSESYNFSGDSYIITVTPESEINHSVSFLIENLNEMAVIDSLDFELPITNIIKVQAYSNGKIIPTVLENNSGFTKLKLDLVELNLIKGKKENIKLDINTKNKNNSINLHLPSFELINKEYAIKEIHYPKKLDDNLVIIPKYLNKNQQKIDLKNLDGSSFYLFLKGQNDNNVFNLNSKIKLNSNIINIFQIPQYNNKSLTKYLESINNSIYGVIDKLGNTFTVIDTLNKETEINFKFSNLKDNNYILNDYTYPKNLPNWEDINDVLQIDTTPELLNNLDLIHKKLKSKYKLNKENKISFAELDKYLNRLIDITEINPVDYVIVIGSFLEKNKVPFSIDYGFPLAENGFNEKYSPHIWILTNINNEEILIDPFLMDFNKVKSIQSDRSMYFKFGSWDKSQKYNNLLGLVGGINGNVVLTRLGLEDEGIKSAENDLILENIEFLKLHFGNDNKIFLNIINPNSTIKEIKNISLGGINIYENNLDDFRFILLPRQSNKISLGISELVLLKNFNTSKTELKIELEDKKELTLFTKIELEITNYQIVFILTIAIFILSIVVLVNYKNQILKQLKSPKPLL